MQLEPNVCIQGVTWLRFVAAIHGNLKHISAIFACAESKNCPGNDLHIIPAVGMTSFPAKIAIGLYWYTRKFHCELKEGRTRADGDSEEAPFQLQL